MGRLLQPLLSRVAPLRTAHACDPFTGPCQECRFSCGSCLAPQFTNYKCCIGGCECCTNY